MLRRGFRALRLGIAWMALISLASEVWTLLSDDLFSVIFKKSTPVSSAFNNKTSPRPVRDSRFVELNLIIGFINTYVKWKLISIMEDF